MYDHELAALGKHVIASSAFVSELPVMAANGILRPSYSSHCHLWSLVERFICSWPVTAVIYGDCEET